MLINHILLKANQSGKTWGYQSRFPLHHYRWPDANDGQDYQCKSSKCLVLVYNGGMIVLLDAYNDGIRHHKLLLFQVS